MERRDENAENRAHLLSEIIRKKKREIITLTQDVYDNVWYDSA